MGGQLQQAAVEGQVEHGAQAYGREIGVDRGGRRSVRTYRRLQQADQHSVGVAQQVVGQGRLVGEQLGHPRPRVLQALLYLRRQVADRRAEGRIDGRTRVDVTPVLLETVHVHDCCGRLDWRVAGAPGRPSCYHARAHPRGGAGVRVPAPAFYSPSGQAEVDVVLG
ncbi:hypothetical protein [Nonomuraea sp. KM90]|uniref:hypothetical protein n=1 Tax=Nonomuraea sp. KM90 TaxID=3457428 RepID=UPI003FCC8171